MKQPGLALVGGHHAGPLFVIVKRRAPKRPPHSTTMAGILRRQSERRATPTWSDRAATRAMFAEAERLTRETGITHSVDHLVPLNNPLVCGLHWHGNMAIATLADNMRKANSTWPDMWGQQLQLIS